MRIYKEQKTGRWYVDYYFRGRRVRYPAGKTKKDAEGLGSSITQEIFAGNHDPIRKKREVKGKAGSTYVFDDLVKRFLLEYKPRSGRQDYYKEQSQVWLRFFTGRETASITSRDVERMLAKRLEEVSSSTARKDVVSLSTFFRWAKRMAFVSTNPADAECIKRPPETFDPSVSAVAERR